MNLNIKTRIPLALATAMVLTCMWGGSSAFADEQIPSERVTFQDLNVGTPQGVQTLYARIHTAAKRVCYQSDPILYAAEGACARKAESNAVEKLNLPQLTAYYKSKTGGQTQPLVAAR